MSETVGVLTPPDSIARKAIEYVRVLGKSFEKGTAERDLMRSVYKELKRLEEEERSRLYDTGKDRPMCGTCSMEVTPLNPYHVARGEVVVMMTLADLHRSGVAKIKAAQDGESLILPDGPDFSKPYVDGTKVKTIKEFRNRCRWMSYFGLVDTDEGDGRRGSSVYFLSDLGWNFLKGKASVPETIYVRQGNIFLKTVETVTIQDAKDLDTQLYKDYWDTYASNQKKFDPTLAKRMMGLPTGAP